MITIIENIVTRGSTNRQYHALSLLFLAFIYIPPYYPTIAFSRNHRVRTIRKMTETLTSAGDIKFRRRQSFSFKYQPVKVLFNWFLLSCICHCICICLIKFCEELFCCHIFCEELLSKWCEVNINNAGRP